jgi:hypothetical protein
MKRRWPVQRIPRRALVPFGPLRRPTLFSRMRINAAVTKHGSIGRSRRLRHSPTAVVVVTAEGRRSSTASSAEARPELLLMLLNFLTAAAVAIPRPATTG